MAPRNFKHTQSEVNALIAYILKLDDEAKVCLECTGRYYEPRASWLHDAGIFVSAVNPLLIKNFGGDSIREAKTDKKDAIKIARYTLGKWNNLKEYTNTDEVRNQLKTMKHQFEFYIEQRTAMKNNLIAILDKTYPGVNNFFDSLARKGVSQKWMDFAYIFWHVDIVRSMSLEEFSSSYKGWCKANGYNFSQTKAKEVYDASLDLIAVLPMNEITQILVQRVIDTLNATSQTVEAFRLKMDEIASTLPEYPVVIDMYGVCRTLGPQLIAEIGATMTAINSVFYVREKVRC
ncbi:MAG: IS110 family transposase [Synergistaceae bacterium]|nr:IS110 family transposase [Synergistaceae bacterium]